VQFLKVVASNWTAATGADEVLESYCKRTGQQQHFVIWAEDTEGAERPLADGNLDPPHPRVIYDIFDSVAAFKPLGPRTAHFLVSAAILKGGPTNLLFVGQTPSRANCVRYLDPVGGGGRVAEATCDDLAARAGDQDVDAFYEQLEGDSRDQVIQSLFDASTSMGRTLDSDVAEQGDFSRCAIAKDLVRTFRDRSFLYRLKSAYGLYSFASTVDQLCPPTSSMEQFEGALVRIDPGGSRVLYRAIDRAARDLIDGPGASRAGARRRIIVISDGEDSEWGKADRAPISPVVLTQYLIDSKIVVDAVLIDENGPLWAICELTGGLAFRPRTPEEGLRLVEQEAFLNITVRHSRGVYPAAVTQAVFDAKLREFAPDKCAVDAGNRAVAEASEAFPLASPLYAVRRAFHKGPPPPEGVASDDNTGQRRFARVVSEVKRIRNVIAPDFEVWAHSERIDKLRVFFQGPPASPFAGRWWTLYVTFPQQYPNNPPDFRFVGVPYHPNVSPEGKVLFSLVDRAFTPDRRVADLIIATRDLLGAPEAADALNRDIGEEFAARRAEYERKARDSAARNGKGDLTEWRFADPGIRRYNDDDPVRPVPMPIILPPVDDDLYD
jgi:ubiquitin-protein ligase